MSFRTLCCSGLVALLAGSAALGDNYSSSPPRAPAQMQMHPHRNQGGHMRLAPELKIIWRQEEHAHLKSLPEDQRRGWIRSQWAAMTPEQRNKKVAELQAHWNALPANVRQTVLERHKERRQERMATREGQGRRGRDNYGHPGNNPQ